MTRTNSKTASRPWLWAGTFLLGLALGIGGIELWRGSELEPELVHFYNTSRYALRGDIGILLEDGEVVISRGAGVLGSSEEIGRAAIAGGQFALEGEFDYGGVVRLVAYDAGENAKGSLQFILGPGENEVQYESEAAGLSVQKRIILSGWKRGDSITFATRPALDFYNQRVIASWKEGWAYQQALADYRDVMARRKEVEEGDEGFEEIKQESWDRYNALNKIRYDALRAIAESDEDPLASLYALQLGGMGGEQALARMDVLQADLGEHPALLALRSRIQQGMEMRATASALKEGAQVEDFSSVGLDGQDYQLRDARGANDYVLVEFWASWCGPCRAENPNLIASYQNYGPRGFEVFAYSLDEDRDDWAEASEEDGIPWINTSDLLAYASPIPGQFGVMGIPMNYLLDADGVLVARNLRGEKLNEKLAELIDGIPPPANEEQTTSGKPLESASADSG